MCGLNWCDEGPQLKPRCHAARALSCQGMPEGALGHGAACMEHKCMVLGKRVACPTAGSVLCWTRRAAIVCGGARALRIAWWPRCGCVGELQGKDCCRERMSTFASSEIKLSRRVWSTPSRAQMRIGAQRINMLPQTFFRWYAQDLRSKALTWRVCTCSVRKTLKQSLCG